MLAVATHSRATRLYEPVTLVRLGATSLALALYITNVAADFAPSAASLDYGSGIYARAVVALMLSSVVGAAPGVHVGALAPKRRCHADPGRDATTRRRANTST